MASIAYFDVSSAEKELEEREMFELASSVLESEAKTFGPDADIDLDKAKDILRGIYAEGTDLTIASVASETALSERGTGAMSACDDALFSLTIDVAALFMALLGLPGRIGKRAAKAIAKKAGRELTREVGRIAREYFQDASDLLSVANGLVKFFEVLLRVLSPGKIISTIIGSMKFWEVPIYSAIVISQVVLLFAASAPTIVVKLAVLTPAVVGVVSSTVNSINACS